MPDELAHRYVEAGCSTLIVHAEDDTLQLYDNAAFAAATIPGARLLRFERGGHFVVIIEQATVREAVQRHIRDHVGERSTLSPYSVWPSGSSDLPGTRSP